ncbi:MAG: alanine racemase [Acidiferrobacterales bacterium]
MTRPARALIDAQALRHNLDRVRQAAPQSKIMAVLKANGYGHGLISVARVLLEAHAFAVASFDEALTLRNAGVAHPTCLLEGFFDDAELGALNHYRFATVVHHESQLRRLERAAQPYPFDVWLKIDTGMHRIGFSPERVQAVLERLRQCRCVGRIRLMSHLANADDANDSTTTEQIARFTKLAKDSDMERSLANSAGILAWPGSHLDWVRPGIMLYGVSPLLDRTAEDLELQPAMTLTSQLIAVNRQRKGERVGYGGEWTCPEDMLVGVVAMGYGDGYPRHAPGQTPVLINGKRVPLIGRVSMDMITVDLRNQPDAKAGDPVVLWGKGLSVEEVAKRAGTIGYELLARMPARVPRVEVNA